MDPSHSKCARTAIIDGGHRMKTRMMMNSTYMASGGSSSGGEFSGGPRTKLRSAFKKRSPPKKSPKVALAKKNTDRHLVEVPSTAALNRMVLRTRVYGMAAGTQGHLNQKRPIKRKRSASRMAAITSGEAKKKAKKISSIGGVRISKKKIANLPVTAAPTFKARKKRELESMTKLRVLQRRRRGELPEHDPLRETAAVRKARELAASLDLVVTKSSLRLRKGKSAEENGLDAAIAKNIPPSGPKSSITASKDGCKGKGRPPKKTNSGLRLKSTKATKRRPGRPPKKANSCPKQTLDQDEAATVETNEQDSKKTASEPSPIMPKEVYELQLGGAGCDQFSRSEMTAISSTSGAISSPAAEAIAWDQRRFSPSEGSSLMMTMDAVCGVDAEDANDESSLSHIIDYRVMDSPAESLSSNDEADSNKTYSLPPSSPPMSAPWASPVRGPGDSSPRCRGRKPSKARFRLRPKNENKTKAVTLQLTHCVGSGGFAFCDLANMKSAVAKALDGKKAILKRMFKNSLLKCVNYKPTEEVNVLESMNPDMPGFKYVACLLFSFERYNELIIATEFCDGGSLAHFYFENKEVAPEMTQHFLAELALAVDALHNQFGIMHRDVKPENVCLTIRGQVKLIDFGLAVKALKSNHPCGTPGYMAPVMNSSLRKWYGPEVDWYSYGVTAYTLLSTCYPEENRPFVMHVKLPDYQERFLLDLVFSKATSLNQVFQYAYFEGVDFEALAAGQVQPPGLMQFNRELPAKRDVQTIEIDLDDLEDGCYQDFDGFACCNVE
jgi:hypothetical protein